VVDRDGAKPGCKGETGQNPVSFFPPPPALRWKCGRRRVVGKWKVFSIFAEKNKYIMVIASYTELRNNMKGYLDMVVENSEPLIVHRSGDTGVVVISLDEYNSMKETEYIRKSPAMMSRLKEAETAMHEGKGTRINIDAL
jgi:antitoxin YefM